MHFPDTRPNRTVVERVNVIITRNTGQELDEILRTFLTQGRRAPMSRDESECSVSGPGVHLRAEIENFYADA